MATFPAPQTGIVLTHFIVSEDIARSRRFLRRCPRRRKPPREDPRLSPSPTAGSSSTKGGPPTEDKPTVTLTAPDPDTISSFLNIRVANIQEIYEDWSSKGAQFLTPPIDRGPEFRCYMRDPDGHLIEVGQSKVDFLEEHGTSDSAGN